MNNLISAIQFLTLLPVGKTDTFRPEKTIPYFPIVGIVLGVLLCLFDGIMIHFFPVSGVAILDVVFLALITGAFHLDGLGDTADGLYGNRPKEKALAIMKDSRVGVMGVVAIVCAILIKWSGIENMTEHRYLLLLIIPSYSRASMMFGFRFLEYGRPEGGTGADFFKEKMRIRDFSGLIIPIALSLFAGWRGVLINVSFCLITAFVLYYYKQRLGCITGDMLGAMAEICESILFLMASITLIS